MDDPERTIIVCDNLGTHKSLKANEDLIEREVGFLHLPLASSNLNVSVSIHSSDTL